MLPTSPKKGFGRDVGDQQSHVRVTSEYKVLQDVTRVKTFMERVKSFMYMEYQKGRKQNCDRATSKHSPVV